MLSFRAVRNALDCNVDEGTQQTQSPHHLDNTRGRVSRRHRAASARRSGGSSASDGAIEGDSHHGSACECMFCSRLRTMMDVSGLSTSTCIYFRYIDIPPSRTRSICLRQSLCRLLAPATQWPVRQSDSVDDDTTTHSATGPSETWITALPVKCMGDTIHPNHPGLSVDSSLEWGISVWADLGVASHHADRPATARLVNDQAQPQTVLRRLWGATLSRQALPSACRSIRPGQEKSGPGPTCTAPDSPTSETSRLRHRGASRASSSHGTRCSPPEPSAGTGRARRRPIFEVSDTCAAEKRQQSAEGAG